MKLNKRWFGRPLASLGLLLVWLLLVNDFTSVGHWFLGAALGVLIPYLFDGWWPNLVQVHSWQQLGVFICNVFLDIVKANYDAAKLTLGSMQKLKPRFIEYNFEVENDLAIFILAGAISVAPLTFAVSVDKHKKIILVHALHSLDDEAVIKAIQERYEAPLKKVFPC